MSTANGTTNGHATDEAIDVLYSFFPGTTPAPQALPEAAFSLTLKGTLGGVEALLTARGQTAAEFKANVESIKGLLDAVPVKVQGPTQASSTGEGWCSKHGLQMRLTTKDGRSWHSHYDAAAGRWCKGK